MEYEYSNTDAETVVTTAMIDGQEITYDACSNVKDAPMYSIYDYLGEGVMHKTGDVLQESEETLYFWKRKPDVG